jgi:hypothetical protein
VLTAQGASQFATVTTLFSPIAEGVVRIEATVAFDRLADGFFLQTSAGSGPFPLAVVTRLITRDFGEIQDDATRTTVGFYAPNKPFQVRMDIDMSADQWSVVVDNEMNGFNDDPVISNLPFENPVNHVPTVGAVWASISLFPTFSVAPTAVAYDDIRVFVPALTVAVDVNPVINPNSQGVIFVAIVSTSDFDATTVDPDSVRFGPDGAFEAHRKGHIEDLNADGKKDLVLHFRTQETGIRCGDTIASLTGTTFDGDQIQGADSIKTAGCRSR